MVNDQLIRIHQLKQLLALEKMSPETKEKLCDSGQQLDLDLVDQDQQKSSDQQKQQHSSSPQISEGLADTCKQVDWVAASPTKNNTSNISNTGGSNNESPPARKSGIEGAIVKKQNSNSSGTSSNQSTKRRSSWRNLLTPSYKSRSDEFHKLFCDKIPKTERLIADYACALHREILIQGRVYISINYIAFYSNLFSWITKLVVRLRDISEIYKANTARIIPNAIQIITTSGEKHIFASFVARDKSYVMMLRIWQNNLMNERMTDQEIRNLVHFSYGKDLGMNDNEELKINSPDPVTPANVPLKLVEIEPQSSRQAQNESFTDEQVDSNNNSSSSQQLPDKNNERPLETLQIEGDMEHTSGHTRYNSFDYNSSAQNPNQDVIAEVFVRLNELSSSYKEPESFQQNNGYSPAASSAVVVDTPPVVKKSSSPIPIDNSGESTENRHSIGASSTETKVPNDIAEEEEVEDSEEYDEESSAARRVDGEELIELTTNCGCQEHQGQLIIDQEFNINVDTLFTLIFTNSKFMRTYMIRRGMTDTIISGWKRSNNNGDRSNSSTLSDEGRDGAQLVRIKQVRQLNYSLNINHIWAKQVQIEERQNIHQVKDGVYVLRSQTKNSGIPYGEAFTVDMSYCLTRNGDINKSKMLIHSFVNFNKDKQNWKLAMVKSMIEKQSLQGVNEFIGDLTSSIKEYIAKTLERSKNSKENLEQADEKSESKQKCLHQYQKAPLDSHKSSLSQHPGGNARYQHHYRHISLARAKSKLKEKKLKNIYRYYIHNDEDGDIEGGANLHCFDDEYDDEGDHSIELSDTGSSLPSFSDNGSMMMMVHGTDDQVSDNGSFSFHGTSEELDRNASWLEDNGSIDRSFSDVDMSRRSRRSVNRRTQQHHGSSAANENHLKSTLQKSSTRARHEQRGRSSGQNQPQLGKTSTIPRTSGGYLVRRTNTKAADTNSVINNSTNAQHWSKSASPQTLGDFRFGTISMKNLAGLVIVVLLIMLIGMIVSHVMILRRLDALEARFRMKCERIMPPTDNK